MKRAMRPYLLATAVLAGLLGMDRPSLAQSSEEKPVRIVVDAGRPLRVALDKRTFISGVGQPVTGLLAEPVYAHDRVVVPAGTKVIGQVAKLESRGKAARTRAMLAGDFSPRRRVSLQFDRLILADGRELPVRTATSTGAEGVVRVAEQKQKTDVVSRAKQELGRQAKEAASIVTAPGKGERFKDMAIRSLPYHKQFLSKGTVYSAPLLSELDFGTAVPSVRAPAGAVPEPDSILHARLTTPVDSRSSPAGTRIEAMLTRPVFSAAGRLIYPEGTRLFGEVTYSRGARSFHRHGRLRFLFGTAQPPDRSVEDLRASLHAVQSSLGDRVAVDEEGGTTSTSPTARLAAPALAALALAGNLNGRLEQEIGEPPETEYGGVASGAVGGFLGLSVLGVGLNQLGHAVTVATGAIGLARTVYSTVFAKGREISFPANTYIEIQTGPGRRTEVQNGMRR